MSPIIDFIDSGNTRSPRITYRNKTKSKVLLRFTKMITVRPSVPDIVVRKGGEALSVNIYPSKSIDFLFIFVCVSIINIHEKQCTGTNQQSFCAIKFLEVKTNEQSQSLFFFFLHR